MTMEFVKSAAAVAAAVLAPAAGAWAQSLNVKVANGATYNYAATTASNIAFDCIDSEYCIAVEGHRFELDKVEVIYVGRDLMPDNTVAIAYRGTEATVTVAGNIAPYVEAKIDGADVKITQSADVSDTLCGEITYTLCGESPNGSLKLEGDYKATLILNELQLTSLTTAPINIDCGKRIAVKLTEGTANSLADAPGGSHKGVLVCKGHLEFKQKGALTIAARTAHGIAAKEYVELKNSTITIAEAVKDGINCAQYFAMESGALTIASSGDDGIQVDYKDTENREADDTGSITVKNGTLTILTTAPSAKSLKAEGDITINGGTLALEVRGNGTWDGSNLKTKASACLGADGNVAINGGTLNLTATGSGGKGISCDGALQIAAGTLGIRTTGGLLVYSSGTLNHNYTGNTDRIATDLKSSPKGIKADGDVTILGGDIAISTTGNGAEGIESKAKLTVSGGTVSIKAYDDGMNSASDMLIAGGDISVVSTAGDGLDSNANITVSGGTLCTFGGGGMEQGLDSSTETGCTVKFTGGTILAVGGGSSSPTSTATTQPFVALSGVTLKAGNVVTVKSGDTTLATITVPAFYGTTSTPLGAPRLNGPGGGGGFGGGGTAGGSGGTVVSVPGMVSGQSYTVIAGTTTLTATAKLR